MCDASFCRCSLKKRVEKTDGYSRLMCARCGLLIDESQQPKKPATLIERIRAGKL